MAESSSPSTLANNLTESEKKFIHELQDIRAQHNSYEDAWTSRYEMLESYGYRLRPRFRPGWVPSWHGTDLNPFDCEDGHFHFVS